LSNQVFSNQTGAPFVVAFIQQTGLPLMKFGDEWMNYCSPFHELIKLTGCNWNRTPFLEHTICQPLLIQSWPVWRCWPVFVCSRSPLGNIMSKSDTQTYGEGLLYTTFLVYPIKTRAPVTTVTIEERENERTKQKVKHDKLYTAKWKTCAVGFDYKLFFYFGRKLFSFMYSQKGASCLFIAYDYIYLCIKDNSKQYIFSSLSVCSVGRGCFAQFFKRFLFAHLFVVFPANYFQVIRIATTTKKWNGCVK
jgi:hypothetical protein